jgi:membrane protein implicated in regulation of membrane protease activity
MEQSLYRNGDGMLLEKLEIIITILASLVVAAVSVMSGADLFELAYTLVITIIVFYIIGIMLRYFLEKTIKKNKTQNRQDDKKDEKDINGQPDKNAGDSEV